MADKNIACVVGHSILKNGNITSADGKSKGGVNEYLWCKEYTPILVEAFNYQDGYNAQLIMCPERKFTKSSEEKTYKLDKINNKGFYLVIENHLNAHNGSAKGTETLYYSKSSSGKAIAQAVNDKLDDVFTDRGIKARDDLYILKQTQPTAILNEYFFCDNKEDYIKADELHEMQNIALKVVEGVIGKTPKNPFKKTEQPAPTNKFYRVITGSFNDRAYADSMVAKLKKEGYSPFIEVFYK